MAAPPASPKVSAPWASNGTAQGILIYVHFASPLLLLVVFLVAFTTHSIVTAPKGSTVKVSTEQKGPGGKPLPQNKGLRAKADRKLCISEFSPARKLLFTWLSVGTILTFVGNAVVVIVHAIVKRGDSWWCGQHVAVRTIRAHCQSKS